MRTIVITAAMIFWMTGCDGAKEGPTLLAPSANTGVLDAPHTVRFPIRETVIDRIRLRGSRSVNGGCNLTHTVTLKQGEAVFESVSEYDPDTCEFVVVRHPPHEARFHQTPSRRVSAFGATSGNNGASHETLREVTYASGNFAAASSHCPQDIGYDRFVTHRLWYEDPIGIEVNYSKQDNVFFFDGTCVQYASSTYTSWWNSGSGWYLTGHSHDLYPEFDWEQITGVGASTMQNDTFCAGGTTYARYSWNEVRMFYDGYVAFDLNFDVSGACSSWLSPRRYAEVF